MFTKRFLNKEIDDGGNEPSQMTMTKQIFLTDFF